MFKKIIKIILVCFIFLFFGNSIQIKAYNQNKHDLEVIHKVTEMIKYLEGEEELEIISFEILYDIEKNPTYLYIKFSSGYAISSRENGIISEYDLMLDTTNYTNLLCQYKLYAGPFNYGCHNQVYTLIKNNSALDELIKKNREFLAVSDNINTSFNSSKYSNVALFSANWSSTIPSSRMSRYASGKWINSNSNYPPSNGYPSNGICGTISAAGLLAYYDDYINDNYVPSSIRARNSSDPGTLITTLFNYIDKGKNGTIPTDVSVGINQWLQNYGILTYGHRTGFGVFTFSNAKSKIDAGRPVCIGLLTMLGSPEAYGDHWTLAYQYIDDAGTSNDMYKTVDNHGSYTKTFYVSWTSGIVFFED